MKQTKLILTNNEIFKGFSPTWQKNTFSGEIVFTTGMTGYVETLTDPSYAGQTVVFTYPLIGNYGIPAKKNWESKKIHAKGVVVSQACTDWSHQTGKMSLLSWLKKQKIPIITSVDTRALTKMIREYGVMMGAIDCTQNKITPSYLKKLKKNYKNTGPDYENFVSQVTTNKKTKIGNGKRKIIVVDCGMKQNIIRHLQNYDLTMHRVPYDYDYTNENFDGIIISNGPGDPTRCSQTISVLQKAMKLKKPIFGICLGTQIMALAAKAQTYKLPYGHRGQNQPCIEVSTKHCYVTSQNHGYAIKEKSLPKDWCTTFKNLNDGSVEGIAHKKLPFFSVQFHPEANPGPTDTSWLFKKFYNLL